MSVATLDPDLTGNPNINPDYDLQHSPDQARWTPALADPDE